MPSLVCVPFGVVKTFLASAILSGGVVPADTTTPRWGLTRERVFGAEGVGPSLTRIQDVLAGRAGTLYVLDASEPYLHAFAVSGLRRWSVGRRGDGPQEFRTPSVLGHDGQTLWVADRGFRRFTRFDPAGKLGTHIVLANRGGPSFQNADPLALVGGDSILAMQVVGSTSSWTGESQEIAVLRGSLATGRSERLALFTASYGRSSIRARVSAAGGGSGQTFMPQPFNDDPIVQASRDGRSVVIVHRTVNDSPFFSVTVILGPGDTLFAREYPYEQTRLDDREFGAAIERISQPRPGAPRGIAYNKDDIRVGAFRPKTFPPVASLKTASDGTTWLLREYGELRQRWTYLVLDRAGTPIGTVELPAREKVMEFNGTYLWTVGEGSAGEPIVIQYRVSKRGP